jgi:hypothetical protein
VIGGRRTWFVVPAAAGALVAAMLLGVRDAQDRPACRRLLIPAYVPPDAVLELVRAVRPRLLVINPASGPGTSRDRAYRDAVRAAQRAGGRVLGYVPTGYGMRDPAQVAVDIDRYESWYGTDGIFLDEAATAVDQLAYYRGLAAHVRAAGERLVVLNPGTVPDRAYFDVADVIVTFEGPYPRYAAALEAAPEWTRELDPERVAVLVYGASREQAVDVVAGSEHVGYVYATSGTLPDPWRTLPAYLREQKGLLGECAAASAGENTNLEVAA